MINKQNRSKILLSIIAILLVANIAMVYFFLMKKDDDKQRGKRPDRRAMIADFLKKDIGFDMVQLQQYDTLSNLHKEDMKKMFDSLGMAKDKQFKELVAGNFSDSVINVVAEKSGASQKIMEQEMRESGGDRDAMMAMRKELNDARDTKLKVVLTADQMKKWKDEIEPSMRPQRGGGQGGGRN